MIRYGKLCHKRQLVMSMVRLKFILREIHIALCTQDVVSLTEQVGDAGILFVTNDVYDMAEKKIAK